MFFLTGESSLLSLKARSLHTWSSAAFVLTKHESHAKTAPIAKTKQLEGRPWLRLVAAKEHYMLQYYSIIIVLLQYSDSIIIVLLY